MPPLSRGFVEVATGMHYWDGTAWADASEVIEIVNGSAIARQGQMRVIFGAQFNTAGLIDLEAPDGSRFRSHVIGIAYLDAATGQSVLIAQPRESIGGVLGNQVIYQDAFDGPFSADAVYTYTRAGFEQDILIREALPDPGLYGLGPDVRIEVWSEFIAPPEPRVRRQVLRGEPNPARRQAMAMPDVVDETLDFGALTIGSGRAFAFPGAPDSEGAVVVGKNWVVADGRRLLVESLDLAEVAPLLAVLPKPGAARQAALARPRPRPRAELAAALPRPKAPDPQARPAIQMAKARPAGPALLIDYAALNSSQTNYTFKGDLTYWISGTVNLYGTNYLEGSAILKFSKNASATLDVKGTLIAHTELFRPAILTARDDATVGENLGSSLSGHYATKALHFDYVTSGTLASLTNIRVLHAVVGIGFNGGSGHELRHVQLVNCGTGVKADNAQYAFRNVLGWNMTNALAGTSSTGVWEHATLDVVTNLVAAGTGLFTNCLLTVIGNTNGLTGAPNVFLSSATGVYTNVGSGSHYLVADSPYRDIGTDQVNPALASELGLRTTYPPLVLTRFLASTTLRPQAGRDVASFDLGFHYAPLDYFASGVALASNVTVLVTDGAAVGLDYSGSSWGFLFTNAHLLSIGSPLRPNQFVRAHLVQEKSGGNPFTRACFYDGSSVSGSRQSTLRMRFTDFGQAANDGYLLYVGTRFGAIEWTHGRIWAPSFVLDTSGSGTLVCGFTNVVLERGGVQTGLGTTGGGVSLHLRNNLLRNTYWHFVGGNTTWSVRDNLFDTLAALADYGSAVENSWNAYTNVTYALTGGSNNVGVAGLAYERGPLSWYYQPTNSTLVNAGSLTNAGLAGLWSFTTATNQVAETNSVLDIGPHWIALNASLQPLDSDGDGIPDYREDVNGNGVLESGETDPGDGSDPGLRVFITRPKSGSALP